MSEKSEKYSRFLVQLFYNTDKKLRARRKSIEVTEEELVGIPLCERAKYVAKKCGVSYDTIRRRCIVEPKLNALIGIHIRHKFKPIVNGLDTIPEGTKTEQIAYLAKMNNISFRNCWNAVKKDKKILKLLSVPMKHSPFNYITYGRRSAYVMKIANKYNMCVYSIYKRAHNGVDYAKK